MHTSHAEYALSPLPELAEVAPLLLAHHERFDGLGWPDGLSGDAVPPMARVLIVANAYDNLVAGSSTGAPMSSIDACEHLGDELIARIRIFEQMSGIHPMLHIREDSIAPVQVAGHLANTPDLSG